MSRMTITHYDFSDLSYSGYYLTGFQENASGSQYEFKLSRDVPPMVRAWGSDPRWRGIFFSIGLFHLSSPDEDFYFCIDARDSCEAGPDRGEGYHLPLLRQVRAYFKVNYNAAIVQSDPELSPFADKIHPALPFFSIRPHGTLGCVPRVVPARALGWGFRSMTKRVRTYRSVLPMERFRQMRGGSKDLDIFFAVKFYGQKQHAPHNEFRYRLMKELQRHTGIRAEYGFAAREGALPGKYAEFRIDQYPLRKYLDSLARSRVGVYVRGVHDCLSFKFGHFLAMGLPVAGQTLWNNVDALMKNRYFDEQFAFQEPEAVARAAVALAGDPERCVAFGESNARVFDEQLSPRAAVLDILDQLGVAPSRVHAHSPKSTR